MQFRCLVSQGCKLKIPQFEVNDIDMFEVEIFVVFVITFCYWGFLSQTSKMFVRLFNRKRECYYRTKLPESLAIRILTANMNRACKKLLITTCIKQIAK